MPEAIVGRALEQYGVVSLEQLHNEGLSDGQVHRLVRARRLERVGTSCLRFPGHPETWRQLLTVGMLDLGDDALVGRRSAACLLGLDGFGEGPVSFLVPRRNRNLQTVGAVHSSARIRPIDRVEIDGFACTSAPRTIVDLAGEVSERELENAVDSALRLGWTSETFLRQQLARLRHRGRPGVALLDRVLDGSGGHSHLERSFLALVRRAGLEKPTCQRIHRDGTRFVARSDFSWLRPKVVAEVAGHATHATRRQRARDAQRHAELSVLGWLVLTFTYEHVVEDPRWVLDTLTRAFQSRMLTAVARIRD